MTRKAIRRKRPAPKPPEIRNYFDWLSAWPCYMCLTNYCRQNGLDVANVLPEARAIAAGWTTRSCGRTEIAHVGERGLGQKCADNEVVPLGTKHHRTGPNASHLLGKRFWAVHHLNMETVLATLQSLYKRETEGIQIHGA